MMLDLGGGVEFGNCFLCVVVGKRVHPLAF